MDLLTFGLILFFALHSIPFFPGVRSRLHKKFGVKTWKIGYSLVALTSLVVVGYGYANADPQFIWQPPAWGYSFALYSMPVAMILFLSGNMKTHFRIVLKHPMSLGVILWAVGHLLTSGHLASIKLFGAFAVFSLVSIVSAEIRGQRKAFTPLWKDDLRAVLNGGLAYALFFYLHGWLFGAPLT